MSKRLITWKVAIEIAGEKDLIEALHSGKIDCRINRRQLILYRQAKVADTDCRRWLIQVMKSKTFQRGHKAELMEHARKKFGAGPRLFHRFWQEAIKITGRHDLSKKGRP